MLRTHFWHTIKKPIIGLSPMDGVTDYPFRCIQKKYGKPDVIYTEFTSVEGVCHGAHRLLRDFLFDETHRPIIAQVYGTTPDYFRQTAIVLCELGFDGIDINMGCPAKNVAHSGAGAALITTPDLAQAIIAAVKAGIVEWQQGKTVQDCTDISPSIAAEISQRKLQLPAGYQQPREVPVSVKTRIGYSQSVVNEWIPRLLETKIAAIALHGRTLKQHYSGQADWEEIGKAAELTKQSDTLLLGNGDISSRSDALSKIQTFGLDGALIGRASMGDPYVFLNQTPSSPSLFEIALEHTALHEQTYSHEESYTFLPMRKHLGWYVKSIPHASEIRAKLFQANSHQDVYDIFSDYGMI